MPLPTKDALRYLEATHQIHLGREGLLLYVRKRQIAAERIAGRMFFTRSELDRLARIKRPPGNPNWIKST